MGWRISWYECDKSEPIKKEVIDEEDFEIKANGRMILNNEGTSVWKDLMIKKSDEFMEEITDLYPHPDLSVYSITKQGLLLIIKKYQENILSAYKDWWNGGEPSDGINSILLHNLRRTVHLWSSDLITDLSDDKFKVTNSLYYEHSIYNLITVYKHFDWENKTLVVIGG